MPIGLPTTSPRMIPSVTRSPNGAAQVAAQVHPRVGQGEEGDDAERHPVVQLVLDALQRRLRGLAGVLHLLHGALLAPCW